MQKKIIKNVLPYGIVKKYGQIKRAKTLDSRNTLYEKVEARELYNASGERVHIFYLKDNLSAHQPWGFIYGRTPRKLLWDRMHPGLDIHFYTHQCILDTVGSPLKKFAYLIESETIVPKDYRIFDENKGLEKEFDLIFTHSEKLLNQFSNARFLPASGVWYSNEFSGNNLDEKQYEKKSKNVSMIASNKQMCDLHKFRAVVANELKKNKLADTFGTFDGGTRVDFIDTTLKDYRFQVVIENEVSGYYFTEKILNCFASMTIPIYIGTRKINEYFNQEGIIFVDELSVDNIINVVKKCNVETYEERIEAIKDNYNRVQDYLCVEDYLMKNYMAYLGI